MLTEHTVKQTYNNYNSACRKYNLNYLAQLKQNTFDESLIQRQMTK